MRKPFSVGRLEGTLYEDEDLPMHTHQTDSSHMTFVIAGRLRVHGPLIGDNTYDPGAFLVFDDDVEHELNCKVPGTRFLNILKNPKVMTKE